MASLQNKPSISYVFTRPKFLPQTLNFFGALNLCHSLSYNNISQWTCEIFQIDDDNDKRICFEMLVYTVYRNFFNELTQPAIATIASQFFTIEREIGTNYLPILENLNARCNGVLNLIDSSDEENSDIESFITLLNSAIPNLRWGNADWNKGIGDAFDPDMWVHINNDRVVDSSFLGTYISNLPDLNTMWELYGNPIIPSPADSVPNNAFVLLSAADMLMLSNIKAHILNYVRTDLEILTNSYVDENKYAVHFIHSSSNGGLEVPSRVQPSGHPIYYFDVNANAWVTFE
ncbi:MAG: hypothetical protein LBM93_05935 [Oscillospiraceae bacterium]|jgi:hypothetical protein|nr:hypothetical protein [Oscillospiraceae bacterium]